MAVLLHTGINTPSFLAPAVAPALAADPLYGWLVGGLFAAIALGVVGATRGALGRPSAGRA